MNTRISSAEQLRDFERKYPGFIEACYDKLIPIKRKMSYTREIDERVMAIIKNKSDVELDITFGGFKGFRLNVLGLKGFSYRYSIPTTNSMPTTPIEVQPTIKNYGWQCPKCNCIYAPFVNECKRCNVIFVPHAQTKY